MKAFIFAAGLGTRMRPLTNTCPKPLLPAGGKPLIEYHLEKLAAAGFREVVINTSWLADKLETALGDGSRWQLRIHYSREAQPLETAGGLRHAAQWLGEEPFVAINGDVWCELDFNRLTVPTGLAHLVLVDNPPHHPEGDFVLLADGAVSAQPINSSPTLTFAGIGVYRPQLLQLAPQEVRLGALLRHAMRQGQVTGEHFTGDWRDIGTPQRLAALDADLNARQTTA